MNAINPAPSTASAGSDGRPYEPSMEEILASIRRIIADDQSLPARSSLRDLPAFRNDPPHVADSHAADTEAAVSRVADPQPAPAPPAAAAPEPKTVTAMSPHGHVAAPQFPTPDMPPLAPSILHTLVAVEAAPGESSAAPVLARAPYSSVEPEHLAEPERSVRTHDAASPAADVAVRHHAEPFLCRRDCPARPGGRAGPSRAGAGRSRRAG